MKITKIKRFDNNEYECPDCCSPNIKYDETISISNYLLDDEAICFTGTCQDCFCKFNEYYTAVCTHFAYTT